MDSLIFNAAMIKTILSALTLGFVLSSFSAAQLREPLPVPDIPGYRTLKCDFHLHTVVSDGEVWPTTRVQEAWRDGLDAIAITDHADYNPHKEEIKPDISRVHQLAKPLAERLGILLVPGIEVAEGDIHFNALFVTDANVLQGINLFEALTKARAQDAFVFWNHPGWKQKAAWFPRVAEAYEKKLFQGMELVNGPDLYPEAFPFVDEKKLTILADSDAHQPISPAPPGSARTITLVFASTRDAAGIREALFAGRSAAWMGGEVWGNETYLRGLCEGGMKLETSEIIVRPDGSGSGIRLRNDSSIPLKIRLQKGPDWLRSSDKELLLPGRSILGGPISVTKKAPEGRHQVDLEFEVTNFHVAPDKNLVVRLPLTISVSQ